MNPHYPAVAQRAQHRCEYCLAPEVIFNFRFEVEHITPPSKAGKDKLPNLALACRSCNLFKASHEEFIDPELAPNTKQLISLFNPRIDVWQEHFEIDQLTAEIIGLTPNGRATIACLRLNSPAQKIARTQWVQLGIYP